MKSIIVLIALSLMVFSCNKKHDDPKPEPIYSEYTIHVQPSNAMPYQFVINSSAMFKSTLGPEVIDYPGYSIFTQQKTDQVGEVVLNASFQPGATVELFIYCDKVSTVTVMKGNEVISVVNAKQYVDQYTKFVATL